jgi:imidazole glycerol-phosphate synthase subunit HisH
VIALVDYRAGNLTSVRKALAALGAEVMTPATPAEVARASGVIVPGVGHFNATRAIDADWTGAIRSAVDRGAGLLGICLGMQWLFEGSDEAPALPGFGAFTGRCVRLGAESTQNRQTDPAPFSTGTQNPKTDPAPLWKTGFTTGTQDQKTDPAPFLKVPHVGWNSLVFPRPSRLMAGVPEDSQVYFTHSYAAPDSPFAVGVTTYGLPFTAAVERDRIAGVQFHPEKSGELGLHILRNWLAMTRPT